MLGWTPNKRWLITKPDKLPQNAPAQSEAWKARQATPGCTVRQAIPGFNEKTPWIKRGAAEPQKREEEEEVEKNTGNVRS